MQKLLFIVSLLPFLASTTAPAMASTEDTIDKPAHSPRVALVIGVANYKDQPLLTPLNDARAIGASLRDAGFDVINLENTTRAEIELALKEMNRRLGTKGTGLFYFAGHGIQLSGSPLILPTDAKTETAASLVNSALDINAVARHMSFQRPGQPNMIIIDACLTTPFVSAGNDRVNDIAASASSAPLPAQTLLAYATSPGEFAYDGDGEHALFTRALLNIIKEKGLSLAEIFSRVHTAVSRSTHERQSPWIISSLDNGHVLMPRLAHSDPAGFASLPPMDDTRLMAMKTRGILPQDGNAKYELEFWQSIKDSTDAADFEAYLEAYPDGKFAPLAKVRAERYSKTADKPKPEPKPEPKPAPKQPAYTVTDMDEKYDVLRNTNIRQRPSSSSAHIGELRKGASVQVTGRVTGQNWYQISSGGINGFVYGELIRKKPAPVVKTTPPVKTVTPTPSRIESFQDCQTCPEMLTLPANTFTMGNNRGDPSEKPAHEVSIKQPFAIGKYEVTFGQWNECVTAGACSYKPELDNMDENLPARDLSWSDARTYVTWLSKLTGQAYRLPTEAEWEYAARAGSQTRFWWGDSAGSGHADCKNCGGTWDRKSPAAVSSYPANQFGLHGTSGGVWEWVSDCWHKSYKGAPRDSSAWSKSDCRENVVRGGGWRNDSSYIHSASRFKYDSNVRYLLHGFRVAKTL